MKPSEIGQKAIEKLKQDGWCQCRVEASDGRHCLIGTIGFATTGEPSDGYDLSRDTELSNWNDTPGRTIHEVIAVLEQAVAELMKEGF